MIYYLENLEDKVEDTQQIVFKWQLQNRNIKYQRETGKGDLNREYILYERSKY